VKKLFLAALLCSLGFAAASRNCFAHALLVSSTPTAHSTVDGPDLDINLKFNSRVDGVRSQLHLIAAGGAQPPLSLLQQPAPETLRARAHLAPGHYTLRWQALSTDGHITRGEVPFTVR
jgi:methionine-rich copper-binding protein CopC